MSGIHITVAQYNVVHPFADGLFRLLAKCCECFLQSGAALGMHSLNADLARLVSTGRITREAAERCATNKSDLKNYL